MREEISMENLESVSGGKYVLNGNTLQVHFRDANRTYQLKNCSQYDAMALMDSFIGKYETEKEYDKACIKALAAKGWI